MGLVDHEERPGVRRESAQTGVEAVAGKDHAGVGDCRLCQHTGDVTAREFPLHGPQIVVGDETNMAGRVAKHPAALRHHIPLVERGE